MSFRTVAISSCCKLDTSTGYLVVRGDNPAKVFLDELEVLIIETTAVSITAALLAELVERKVKIIFCDKKRDPLAELVPYHGCYDCVNKQRNQLSWSVETRGAIWTEIVREKIRKQSALLEKEGKQDKAELLDKYARNVAFRDETNREGHAAKVYFNALFGMDFSRSDDNLVNAKLNYGYSLILSLCNREIVTAGYLTQIGIGHDNMFNYFNLGCDVMEPFRPLVDTFVLRHPELCMDTQGKHRLLEVMTCEVRIDGNKQRLPNAVRIYVRSIFDALSQNDIARIKFPYYEL